MTRHDKLKAALEVLRRVEWGGSSAGVGSCPVCAGVHPDEADEYDHEGHHDDCHLAKLLDAEEESADGSGRLGAVRAMIVTHPNADTIDRLIREHLDEADQLRRERDELRKTCNWLGGLSDELKQARERIVEAEKQHDEAVGLLRAVLEEHGRTLLLGTPCLVGARDFLATLDAAKRDGGG